MTKPAARTKETRVLLVGWAGADWSEVDPQVHAGNMPATQALVAEGVRGRLASVRPLLSPMLWTSAVTGKRADKHGICSFYEPLPDNTGLVPVSGLRRRSAAIWDHVAEAGADSIVVGWPVVDPTEPIRGTIVETDHGNRGCVRPADPLIAKRCEELKRAGGDRQSLDASLDSVVGLHTNACELLSNEPWRFAAVCYPVLAAWATPTDQASSDQRVDAGWREHSWRMQDAMLAGLRNAVGPDTDLILISPHGPTHLDDGSPESSMSEPRLGMFGAAGPQFRSGITHYGATVLDVAPTVLRLLGLVEDTDTDGEPWLGCLDLDGSGPSPDRRSGQPALTAEQFASRPRPEPQIAPVQVLASDRATCLQVLENQRVNRALALSDSDRVEDAIACWQELLNEQPNAATYATRLVECLMRDRRYEECRRVIGVLSPDIANRATFQLVLAEIAVAEERFDEASSIAITQTAEPDTPPNVLVRAARILTACGSYAEAEARLSETIESNGASVFAHAGLAELHWDQDAIDDSLAAARKALAIAPALTEARFTLARSLHRIGQKTEAIVEFERCLEECWRPEDTHSYLASLYWGGDPVRAAHHREKAGIT